MNNLIINNEAIIAPTFSSFWMEIIHSLDQSIIDKFDNSLCASKQGIEGWDKDAWSDKATDWANWGKSIG